MSKNLIPPGNYPAKTNAKMAVYEATSRSLCVAVPLNALSPEGNVLWSGKTTITLGNADGVLNTKAIANLKKCFPDWDSTNPFALEEIEEGQHDLEIVGEHESYQPKATDEDPDPQAVDVFKVKWLNAPGGGVNVPQPLDEASRKKVLTKWGAKFKATGSSPAASKPAPAKPAPAAATAAPARKAPPMPPSRKSTGAVARTSSQEEVWAAFAKAHDGEDQDELVKQYYAAQDEVKPNANGELSPAQWGSVAEKLGV